MSKKNSASSPDKPAKKTDTTINISKQAENLGPNTGLDLNSNVEPTIEENTSEEDTSVHNLSSNKPTQQAMDEALDFCQVSQDYWQKGEFEHAVEALDQAYSLILTVDTYDNPKLIQQKEDLRYMVSKRLLEIYASRNIAVNGNHNAIPLVMNKHVEKEIKNFTKNENKFFINSYKRSGKYRQYIVQELEKAGLPVELSWLPLIESGFKINALSKARALGLWQFIPSTGYKFGLKRNIFIDERLDPVKSTKAAIAYLKELHQIFGDWATVLAAYNCGEWKVLHVIRNQNVNYLDDFWDLYERLPRETARYVPKFMATLHMVKNPEQYGLDSITAFKPLEYETVQVSKKVHLKSIAQAIDVSYKNLKELNPELRYSIVPGGKYPLRLPPGNREILLSKLDVMPISSPPRRAFIYHKIRPGEALSTIAERYHTTSGRIARANNINKRNFIVAGKTLKIPLRGTVISIPKQRIEPKYRKATTHVVRKGDSLWLIARYYGTTTKKISALNNLTTSVLQIGQILKIPESKGKKLDYKYLETYHVKKGDSPFTIAKEFNMPLEKFLRLNNLTPRSRIYPGQKLYIQ